MSKKKEETGAKWWKEFKARSNSLTKANYEIKEIDSCSRQLFIRYLLARAAGVRLLDNQLLTFIGTVVWW
jgi:hypothetical protein